MYVGTYFQSCHLENGSNDFSYISYIKSFRPQESNGLSQNFKKISFLWVFIKNLYTVKVSVGSRYGNERRLDVAAQISPSISPSRESSYFYTLIIENFSWDRDDDNATFWVLVIYNSILPACSVLPASDPSVSDGQSLSDKKK